MIRGWRPHGSEMRHYVVMLPLRSSPAVLARPHRRAADVAVHVSWDDLPAGGAVELMTWVRRCRAQGARVHVDVVSPDSVANALLLGLCATSLALHVPTPVVLPDEPGSADELCRQLRLSGVGARVVARARGRAVRFDPALPVAGRTVGAGPAG